MMKTNLKGDRFLSVKSSKELIKLVYDAYHVVKANQIDQMKIEMRKVHNMQVLY